MTQIVEAFINSCEMYVAQLTQTFHDPNTILTILRCLSYVNTTAVLCWLYVIFHLEILAVFR